MTKRPRRYRLTLTRAEMLEVHAMCARERVGWGRVLHPLVTPLHDKIVRIMRMPRDQRCTGC